MASGREGCHSVTSGLFASFNFSSLVGLSCLFFTFPCSWLALHVSWVFPIICSHLFIPTILFFLLTSFTDTGILHKGIEEELMKQATTMNDLNQHWCNRCQLYCLPRTFHCSWCDTCVEEFDHHCVWVNNCIGGHNLRFFLLFVIFLSGYDVAVLASCLVYLALNTPQAFSVEKICTVLVTIPASFYLLPALILLSHQVSNAWAAHRKCQHQASHSGPPSPREQHRWVFCKQQGAEYLVGSAVPVAGAAAWERTAPSAGHRVLRHTNPSPAVPGSCPHGCAQDRPCQERACKAWRHFLAAAGSLLHRTGPGRGLSAGPASEEVDKTKTGWQLNAADKRVEIPNGLDSVELLEPGGGAHWKCQIHGNRHGPMSHAVARLSVSEI